MPATATWTEDRVQTLTRLWRDGASASQIARTLAGGVTRNAVIGKVHRLGLSGRARPSVPGARPKRAARTPRPRRPKPQRPPSPPPRSSPAALRELVCATGSATIASVRRGQCRWPIGDPLAEGFSLCGHPAVRGAYCAAHAAIGYRPLGRRPSGDHLLKLAGLA